MANLELKPFLFTPRPNIQCQKWRSKVITNWNLFWRLFILIKVHSVPTHSYRMMSICFSSMVKFIIIDNLKTFYFRKIYFDGCSSSIPIITFNVIWYMQKKLLICIHQMTAFWHVKLHYFNYINKVYMLQRPLRTRRLFLSSGVAFAKVCCCET